VIIALVSKKGGVGKTTSAVNLSAALAETGRRVLLVDLDSQASASLSLGVDRARLAPSVADVMLWGVPVRQVIRPTGVANLDLLTASVDLISADLELGGRRERELTLRRALDPVRADYDFIFVDCPPSLSLLPINALAAADGFLTPVVPQFLALAGVESVLAGADRVRAHHNRDLALIGVLLTVVDYRVRASRDNIDRLRRELGGRVFAVEIRVNIRLAEAPEHAQTIFQYDPRATGAEAYRLAAEELLLRAARPAPVPAAAVDQPVGVNPPGDAGRRRHA
jgi:chromosome partitioning protein